MKITLDVLSENLVTIDGNVKYCYYDHTKDCLVEIPKEFAEDKDIKYMYAKDDTLVIELDVENAELDNDYEIEL